MSNPLGVPSATNSADYATRPCWTFTYRETPDGPEIERRYYVTRQAEAMSRFNAEVLTAYGATAVFSEVPA